MSAVGRWSERPPAPVEALSDLSSRSGLDLPTAYLDFLRRSNGGEGELSVVPRWFVMWPAEEVIALNQVYEIRESFPGFFAFGSDGRGRAFVFDTRRPSPWPVLVLPFIGLLEEGIPIAEDFESFKTLLPGSPAATEPP